MASRLIINGEIINPPTSISCFRDVTFIAHEYLHLDVIVEVLEKDFYYKFLSTFGAMDYIDDIVSPKEEIGMRIDTDFNYAPTVYVTKIINAKNLNSILLSLGFRGF